MRTCRQLATAERRKRMTAARAAVRTPAPPVRPPLPHPPGLARCDWFERRAEEFRAGNDPEGAAVQDARALRAYAPRRAREEV